MDFLFLLKPKRLFLFLKKIKKKTQYFSLDSNSWELPETITYLQPLVYILESVSLLCWPEEAWNLEKSKSDSDLLGWLVTRNPRRLIYKFPPAALHPGGRIRLMPWTVVYCLQVGVSTALPVTHSRVLQFFLSGNSSLCLTKNCLWK